MLLSVSLFVFRWLPVGSRLSRDSRHVSRPYAQTGQCAVTDYCYVLVSFLGPRRLVYVARI